MTTNFPEWQHKVVREAPIAGYGPKGFIRVTAGLHYMQGNSLPHFSVTAEIWRRHGAQNCEAAGQLTREMLAAFPQLAPVVKLHLSDSAGEPMYAVANSWYQLAGYYADGLGERYHAGNSARQIWGKDGEFIAYREPTPDECLESFAEYVRISVEDARQLVESLSARSKKADGTIDRTTMKWHHAEWIAAQRPRWKAEADAATALLDCLANGGE